MKRFELKKDELGPLAELIKELLPGGGIVILQGDLAAGKTTLVQSVAKAFGIDEAVTSPTFSLQQCYGDTLYHYDIYNKGIEHFLSLGMLEELERPGYHFIEWGDATLVGLLKSAGMATIVIKIEKCAPQKRCYEVEDA